MLRVAIKYIILSVIMLNVIMLNVIILNVAAPSETLLYKKIVNYGRKRFIE